MCEPGFEAQYVADKSQGTILEQQRIAGSPEDGNARRFAELDSKSISHRSSTDQTTSSTSATSGEPRSAPTLNSRPHKAHDAGWEAIRGIIAKEGTVGLRHFRFLQKLGSGDIGSVYLAELRGTSCYFAMKVMDKRALEGRNKLSRAQTEREILEVLDHPFLPTLYAHIEDGKHSCLVMEFCPGGDLHVLRQRQAMRRFSDKAARFYAAEVLLALEYLHMMGIVYRDLKPENVLVREDGHIMLSDFDLSMKCSVSPTLARVAATAAEQGPGLASPPAACSAAAAACANSAACMIPLGCVSPCSVHPIASCLPMPRILQFTGSGGGRRRRRKRGGGGAAFPELVAEPTSARSMSFVGTHEYLAPEIILGDGHGSAVDWWTFGVFLFELLYGRTPFKGSDNELTLMNVVSKLLRFPSPDPSDLLPPPSPSAQDLIRGLLVKDPHKRLAALRGASEIKHHPFFDGVNWALIRCSIPPEIPSPFSLRLSSDDPDPSRHGHDASDCSADQDHDDDDDGCAKAWLSGDASPADSTLPDFELF